MKKIFSLFVLFVMFQPVSNFFSEFNMGVYDVDLDFNYIYTTNLDKVDLLEKDIVGEIENNLIKGVAVIVNANVFAEDFQIDSVYVDVTNAVFDCGQNEIESIIFSVVQKFVSIGKEKIVIYGKWFGCWKFDKQ